jgi:NADP-dependent 3-hydroxy acid dehydrogenase YdfG
MPTSTTYAPHAGRVALVTGTSRGIGQAIAVGLAADEAGWITGQTIMANGGNAFAL